jgi:tRNA A37 threonylcarbamoyltransferase TsaD
MSVLRRRAETGRDNPPPPAQPAAAGAVPMTPDPELAAERERLTERFTVMQTELGGLFYEMAIRDHVRMDVLVAKAAALQRVDAELAQVEHLLAGDAPGIGGHCSRCGFTYAPGASFCSNCAQPLDR